MIADDNRVPEILHIRRNDVGVEPKLRSPEEKCVVSQVSLERVERLGEPVTTFGIVAVGPEQSQQPVAAYSLLACNCDDRQEGQPASLRRRTFERGPFTENEETA
jgi:hypothetical protein